jgi:hypothetical protein
MLALPSHYLPPPLHTVKWMRPRLLLQSKWELKQIVSLLEVESSLRKRLQKRAKMFCLPDLRKLTAEAMSVRMNAGPSVIAFQVHLNLL